jgi:hypothetical protein
MTPEDETKKDQEVKTSSETANLPPAAELSKAGWRDGGEHSPVFDALVTPDGEVAGLVAYAIYKQNKRAWLKDFIRSSGRPPTDTEVRAYIIGESTERRLITYRHLAVVTLNGQSLETLSRGSSWRGRSFAGSPVAWGLVLFASLAILALVLRLAGAFSSFR